MTDYFTTAKQYYDADNYSDAMAHIIKAVNIAPDDIEILEWAGEIAIRLEQYQDAANYLLQARDIDSDIFADWNNLGLALYELSRPSEAVITLLEAIARKHDDNYAHSNLGKSLYDMYIREDKEQAAIIAKQWAKDHPDNVDAQHMGAAISGHILPDRPPHEFVEDIFNDFAPVFEQTLSNVQYQAPTILYELAHVSLDKEITYDIADLGCGTGLSGALWKPHANELIGVDIAEKMLNVAEQKNIYTHLYHAEIEAFLVDWKHQQNTMFDYIILADVLCYFGLLDIIFSQIITTLKPGGHVLFSVEKNIYNDGFYHLHPSGRYQHSHEYINILSQQTSMQVIADGERTLRYEFGEPVQGYACHWRK